MTDALLPLGVPGHLLRSQATPWIEPNVLARGEPTLIEGDGSAGKTLLMMDWCARISRGEPIFPDGKAPAGPRFVVVCSPEDSLERVIHPRLEFAGADFGFVHYFAHVPEPDGSKRRLQIPKDTDLILRVVDAKEAALVVLEPITRLLEPRLSANNDQHVGEAMDRLVDGLRDRLCALLFARHLRKNKEGGAATAGLGSAAWRNVTRLAFTVGPDPQVEGRSALFLNKSNFGRAANRAFRVEVAPFAALDAEDPDGDNTIARVVWDGYTDATADEAVRGHGAEDRREEADYRDFFAANLTAGGATFAELHRAYKAQGYHGGETAFRSALARLARKERVPKPGMPNAVAGNGEVRWFALPTNGNGNGYHKEPIPGPDRSILVCASCNLPVSAAPGPCASCGALPKKRITPEE